MHEIHPHQNDRIYLTSITLRVYNLVTLYSCTLYHYSRYHRKDTFLIIGPMHIL